MLIVGDEGREGLRIAPADPRDDAGVQVLALTSLPGQAPLPARLG